MQADLKSLLDVLGRADSQYVIPVFQRVYSWTKQQCEQVWADMFQATQQKQMHFMGMLITMPEDVSGQTNVSSVIDGQQRLTTITLMLIALRDELRKAGEAQSVAMADEIDKTYLVTSKGECKLVLSDQDMPTLQHLVLGSDIPNDVEDSSFLIGNLGFFKSKMEGSDRLLDVLPAIEALAVISVELGPQDAPQQVFESLNAKGKPLSTTDLIRNTLLVKFGSSGQEEIFERYWTPLDEAFAQFGREHDIYLDAALHRWITEHGGAVKEVKRSDLYQAFKRHIEGKDELALDEMLKSISSSCLEFAGNPTSQDAKHHLDWAIDKPTGMISQRKIFGD